MGSPVFLFFTIPVVLRIAPIQNGAKMKQNKWNQIIVAGMTLAFLFGIGFNVQAAPQKKAAPPKKAAAPPPPARPKAPQIVTGVIQSINVKTDTLEFTATNQTYTCRVAGDADIATPTNPAAALGDLKVGDTVQVKVCFEMDKTVTHQIKQIKPAPAKAEEPTPAK